MNTEGLRAYYENNKSLSTEEKIYILAALDNFEAALYETDEKISARSVYVNQ